ncbi:hypothetical protein ACIHDR_47860 [Nocardia sp. NPDC052278]|uniref:hypothetical protein n=1 Tax=unclassified Nocardia TaxID=2637762 RepID=UPI0036C138D4
MAEDLFGDCEVEILAQRVLMSLNPQYYELIWNREKGHEFRRRYLTGHPTRWFVYLTAPVSRLAAVIDLNTAIVDTPDRIAAIAEQARVGNGESVYEYMRDLPHGFALPIQNVREHDGYSVQELAATLGKFHPPQGYTLIDKHPALAAICDQLAASEIRRDLRVEHPASVP